jgi:hypothetical protein
MDGRKRTAQSSRIRVAICRRATGQETVQIKVVIAITISITRPGVDAAVPQDLGLIGGVLPPAKWRHGAVHPDQKSVSLNNPHGYETQTPDRPAPGREIVGKPPKHQAEIAGRREPDPAGAAPTGARVTTCVR